eukprot:6406996-Amphidinium_carterae.1
MRPHDKIGSIRMVTNHNPRPTGYTANQLRGSLRLLAKTKPYVDKKPRLLICWQCKVAEVQMLRNNTTWRREIRKTNQTNTEHYINL